MRTKKISKDEKLCFALDYIPVEKQYKKSKKHRNIVNILSIIVGSASLAIGFLGNLPTAITIAVLGSIVLLPSMYVFNSKMREVINTVNRSNITFKQFRQMERSGELNKLKLEALELQTSPAYVGIEKFPKETISVGNISSSRQSSASYMKNNDSRSV